MNGYCKYIIILFCLSLCGCDEIKQRRADRDKATITTSFYLITVLHDEHLFIMSNSGYFIHHPSCPCLNGIKAEKIEESKVFPQIIFGEPRSILVKP